MAKILLRSSPLDGAEAGGMQKLQGWASDCLVIAEGRPNMLWTIFVVLMLLWLLGLVSSYTLGGFIHILLVIALAVVLINLIQGRRAV
jgi:hypothetical protein